MLILPGASALSLFALDKLLTRLQALVPTLTGVAAHYVHLVQLQRPLQDPEQQVLKRLLRYGPATGQGSALPADAAQVQSYCVVPRPGTQSPWSSKATDIAHNCGLAAVRRLERGTLYQVAGLSPEQRARILPLLHDRMTQAVLATPEAAEQL